MDDEEVGGPAARPGDAGLAPPGEVPGPTEPAPPGAPAGSADVPAGEDDIPLAPLWAMRTRMHSRRRLEPGEEGRIRRTLGSEEDAVHVIDDGPDHCMVARGVGRAADGCVYCLVARISLEQFGDIVAGDRELAEVFSDARDISLCGVFEEEGAAPNVFLVEHYRRPRDVPADYLPPSPFLEFTDDPEEEA